MRGLTLGLPSGQAVARAMAAEHQKDVGPFGVTPVTVLGEQELPELKEVGLQNRTPLWYYILREAEIVGGGSVLGPVGGRIVAEVFVGLLQGDRLSFLRAEPEWEPLFGVRERGIVGLLEKAGVLKTESPRSVPSNTVWTPA